MNGPSPPGRARTDAMLAAALVLIPLPLRLWLATAVGLSPDECYYWTWSLELAAGYPDHPPAVAWLVRAGSALAGDGPLGIRLPAVLLGGLALPLATLWLGHEAGLRGRVRLLLPAAAALQPLGVAAGLVTTPDTPLLLTWTLASAALLRAVRTRSRAAWLIAGVAAGLAMLSKHSGWLLLASAGVGLLASAEGRQRLRGPAPWAAGGLALALASPNLLWDWSRGFVSLGYQLGHGLGPSGLAGGPARLAELAASQAGLLTPLVAWGAWLFLARGWRLGGAGPRLLWVLAVSPLALFGAAALLARPEANWPAPAHPLLLAGALVTFERARGAAGGARRRRLGRWLAAAVATSGLVTAGCLAHLLAPLPWLPAGEEPSARLRGWNDLPPLLEGEPLVVAEGYELAAALRWHLPGRSPVGEGRAGAAGPRALLVTAAPGRGDPPLPEWATERACPERLGLHPMRRADGETVRTLGLWRLAGCAGAPDSRSSF